MPETRVFYVLPMKPLLFLSLLLAFTYSALADDGQSCVPLKIGVIAPLTGGMAEFGTATRNGIELALRSDPQLHRGLAFIYEDSKYDPPAALTAFRKLTAVDHVDLVYNWGTGPNQAVAPVAETSRIPLLAMTTEGSVSLNRQYVLRYSIYAEQYSLALLAHLRQRKIRTFDIVTNQVAYFEEVLNGITRNLNNDEIIHTVVRVTPEEQDFRSFMPRLSDTHSEGLGVFLIGGQLSQFFLQSKGLLPQRLIFGSNTFDNPREVERAQGSMDGAVYPSIAVTDKFRDQYVTAYRSEVQVPFAAMGYDLVELCAKLADCKRKTTDEIISSLRHIGSLSGATGKISYVEPAEAGPGFDFPITISSVTGGSDGGKTVPKR